MFKIIYFTELLIILAIRSLYRLRMGNWRIVDRHETILGRTYRLLGVGALIIALVYVFTPMLNFADYQLPYLAGGTGAAVFAAAIWLLWRSHFDLGKNWSVNLELRQGQQLITSGAYKYIRHPMYAAFWLWGIAQVLLLHNWIAGWSLLVSFGLFYFERVGREEQMMLESFGEKYRNYMNRTGRIIPRFKWHLISKGG